MSFLPWRYGLLSSTILPPCFPSRNMTKSAETHPLPMEMSNARYTDKNKTALISTILALSMKFQTSLNPLPPFSPPQTHTSFQKGCKKHVAFVLFSCLLTSYITPINGYFRNYFVIIKGNFKSTFVVLYLLRIHMNGLS